MKKIALIFPALALVAAAPQVALAQQAEISLEQARAIALEAAPGRIEKEEREYEDGAERYSFDILQDGMIHEIGIDVRTGRIVEDKFEPLDARD